MKTKQQVILIGLDGADFSLLEREFRAGRLPTLRKIYTEGAKSFLDSTIPPLTFPAWVTFATGVNPGKHGIFDFTEKVPGSYSIRFVNARWRRVPCFWHYLSEKGYRVAVAGVPVTYPPEPINGVLLCGFDAPGVGGGRIDRSSVYPPEFYEELKREFPDYWLGANVIEFGEDYQRIGRRLLEVLKTRVETLLWLYRRERWDCFVGVIGETDAVCHYFWRFYDPASPFYASEKSFLGEFVVQVYQIVDAFLERLLESSPPDSLLILISDHGMGPAGAVGLHLNRYLAEEKFLRFRPRSVRLRGLDFLKKYALRYVPPGIKRTLFRRTGIANLLEGELRFGQIEWSRTVAYSEESPQFPSVYLNVRGRDPEGVIPKGDYCRVAEEVRAALEALSFKGRKLLRRVWLREELYSGPEVERAPDLLLEWNYEMPYSPPVFLKSDEGSPALEELDSLPEFLLVNRTACHRPQGIFMAYGEGVRKGEISASLMDIAPTVMALLAGKKVASMEGRILSEIFPFISGMEDETHRENYLYEEKYMTQEEEEAIKKKLKSLGYL